MTYHARFRERFDERGWMLSEAQIVAVLAFMDSEIARAKAEARDESIHREHKAIAALIEKVKGMIAAEKAAPPANDLERTAEWYKISALDDLLTHLRGEEKPPGDCVYGCTKDYHPCGRYPETEKVWLSEKIPVPKGEDKLISVKEGASFSGRDEEIARMVAQAGQNSIPLKMDKENFTGTYWISANMLYFALTGRHLNHDIEKGVIPRNPSFDELNEVPETTTPLPKCFKDGKIFVCYCGKCENDSYPLPADFPQSREQGGEKCAWAICQNPKDGLAWCREHASPMGFM